MNAELPESIKQSMEFSFPCEGRHRTHGTRPLHRAHIGHGVTAGTGPCCDDFLVAKNCSWDTHRTRFSPPHSSGYGIGVLCTLCNQDVHSEKSQRGARKASSARCVRPCVRASTSGWIWRITWDTGHGPPKHRRRRNILVPYVKNYMGDHRTPISQRTTATALNIENT